MNIRYPIYEGVYRILTNKAGDAKDDNGINPYSGYRFCPVSLCLLQNGLENHRRAEPTILYRWLSHLL